MSSTNDHKIKHSLLIGLTKKLITMSGRSQSPINSQNLSRKLTRREQRKLSRSPCQEAVSQDGNEQGDLSDAGKIPQKPLSRMIALIQFLSSYDDDVAKIERAVASLQEKDKKIRSLSTAIRELKLSNNEEVEILKNDADEASKKWKKLEQEKDTFKQEKEDFWKQRRDEKAKHTIAMQDQKTKLEKKFEVERDKLVKENVHYLELLKEENSQLKSQIESLQCEKAGVEKTLKLYVQHSNDLEVQVKDLKLRNSIQDLSIEHYETKFARVRENIQAITQHYLSILPPENEFNIDEAQKEFSRLNSIFGTISLSASVTSKFLRICGAQCTIIEAIYSRFWQPFYVNTKPLLPETKATLSQISRALSEEDRHKESLWRFLSFKGLDTETPQHDIHTEVKVITGVLRRLILKKEHKAFEIEVEKLLLDSITVWDELKRDSCVVEFDFQPPSFCGPGWVTEDCPDLEKIDLKANGVSGSQFKMHPWCLFPKVVFHAVDGSQKVMPGHAIFVDSLAFHENFDEIRHQEEEISLVKKNLVRRPTIRRGNEVSPTS